jgi:hypothetical protein
MKFRPRFSLKMLLLTVTLVCVGLAAWKIYGERQRQRQLCDQLVDKVLLTKHWVASADTQLHAITAAMANELTSQAGYVSSVLRPDGTFDNGKAADKFEKQILSEWSSTAGSDAPTIPETAEPASLLNRSFVFYKAIRAQQRLCIDCHGQISNARFEMGDLIGIMKIELTK